MNSVMEKTPSSYKQIAKATGIFGGVQVINILISIVRSKFVAVLLGTNGVGLMGLFTATTTLISSVTNLGIGFSAIRTISETSATNNQTLMSRTIKTMRRWVFFTGITGALFSIIFSKQLSQWTFGSDDYRWAFIWLSITLLLQSVTSGQLALLQGLRKLQHLAKANIIGSFAGLFVSLPLYYFLQLKGIVPALIVTALINLILSWYYCRSIPVDDTKITIRESFSEGFEMVKLGSVVMITGFAASGVMYLIRMYISRTGGLEEVGLYAAAWSIMNGYVDMIFTAMGTDYFPRLSAVNSNNKNIKQLVNEQAEMAVLILGPILILLIAVLPLIIYILLTKSFLPIIPLIQWALLGILFKAGSWTIAYILLAKGDRKLYFLSEMCSSAFFLISNIVLYHYFKLEGIGIAFLLNYIFYLAFVFTIAKVKYQFSFENDFIKIFTIQFSLLAIAFLIGWKIGYPNGYIPCLAIVLLSIFYSYKQLSKRIDIPVLIETIKLKFKR
jgi:O-antigen/teichoic acid export membrane protein